MQIFFVKVSVCGAMIFAGKWSWDIGFFVGCGACGGNLKEQGNAGGWQRADLSFCRRRGFVKNVLGEFDMLVWWRGAVCAFTVFKK